MNQLKNYKIKKFQRQTVHFPFIYNIWGGDLADIQLIKKLNKGIQFLLSVIDVFCKYAWVIPFKTKKRIRITNTFQKNVR